MKHADFFADRKDAAEKLAARLDKYEGRNPLILAIPRGAVPMGRIIATRLRGELDVVLVRKLGAPFSAECAVGSIDETGRTHLLPELANAFISDDFITREKAAQLALLHERRRRYSPAREPRNPQGRIAIVIDDGLATGATMQAALCSVRDAKPARLVCAIPVAAPDSLQKIRPLANEVVCLHAPKDFFAVSQYYRQFPPVSDEEVTAILAGRE